eukprot:m.160777 g.160777  ORF g.160777 m.160777 type:complete len:182 (-) comp18040_c0_seq1:1257-1802(-)
MNTKKAHSTDNIETCTLLLSHQRYSLFGMFSDSKSYVNLRKWLQEVVGSSNRRGGGSDALHSRDGNNPTDAENACDPEALIGGGMMKLPPMLVVGAKFDMVGTRAPGHCQFSKDIGSGDNAAVLSACVVNAPGVLICVAHSEGKYTWVTTLHKGTFHNQAQQSRVSFCLVRHPHHSQLTIP